MNLSVCLFLIFSLLAAGLPATAREAALTLKQARENALRNHPKIKVGELLALAAKEQVREQRAAWLPQVSGSVVAVGTVGDSTRLAAVGALNNPSIFDRNAEGLMISQLITDFGRTANLIGSTEARAEAEINNVQATREQILLEVDGAFFAALQAQEVTRVARQTVQTRQLFLDQVSALASNKLRSELDVDFARVNLEDSRLLLSKSQNDLQAAFARLSTLMGRPGQSDGTNHLAPPSYRLVEGQLPPNVSTNIAGYVEQALQTRPDLVSLRYQREAALKLARASRGLRYPAISALGSAGIAPIHDPEIPDTYAAAGLTLNVPLFAGGLYAAKAREADLRAQAAEEGLRDLENRVIQDVRIGWLNVENAFERLKITRDLVENASKAFDLAQARYHAGTSSIVELNQAQLNLVSAQISYADTQAEYLLQRSALDFQIGALH